MGALQPGVPLLLSNLEQRPVSLPQLQAGSPDGGGGGGGKPHFHKLLIRLDPTIEVLDHEKCGCLVGDSPSGASGITKGQPKQWETLVQEIAGDNKMRPCTSAICSASKDTLYDDAAFKQGLGPDSSALPDAERAHLPSGRLATGAVSGHHSRPRSRARGKLHAGKCLSAGLQVVRIPGRGATADSTLEDILHRAEDACLQVQKTRDLRISGAASDVTHHPPPTRGGGGIITRHPSLCFISLVAHTPSDAYTCCTLYRKTQPPRTSASSTTGRTTGPAVQAGPSAGPSVAACHRQPVGRLAAGWRSQATGSRPAGLRPRRRRGRPSRRPPRDPPCPLHPPRRSTCNTEQGGVSLLRLDMATEAAARPRPRAHRSEVDRRSVGLNPGSARGCEV